MAVSGEVMELSAGKLRSIVGNVWDAEGREDRFDGCDCGGACFIQQLAHLER